MNTKYKLLTAILAAGLILNTGCKKYLDINQNPNFAGEVPSELLLSSAEVYAASAIGVDLQINGAFWAQHWTQSPASSQYKYLEQYQPTASNYDRVWQLLYSRCLNDLKKIEKQSTADNQFQYVGVSKIFQAYIFQVITDAWGDIPFSEALKGLPEEGGITSPKYDPQQTVYDGIIQMVKDGRNMLENLEGEQTLANDIIYNGDIQKWIAFANTLELKMYLRISKVDRGKAIAGINSLAGGPFINNEQEEAKIDFSAAAGNQNPLYSEISGLGFVQNIVASATAVDSMTNYNDYRVYVLFTRPVGLPQGAYTVSSSTAVGFPTDVTGALAADEASALAPVRFISAAESKFLQSEAAVLAGGDAAGLFYEGIYAAFNMYDEEISSLGALIDSPYTFNLTAEYAAYAYINGDTVNGFYGGDPFPQQPPSPIAQFPTGGSEEEKIKAIIVQKWLAMVGTQGFEAWTEWRRTGYPNSFTYSVNSIIGQNFPRRFLYPDTEQQRNQNFPGQKTVTTKVWWDIH
jgi:hypothetical protein